MSANINYGEISKKCKKIIQENNPRDSIEKLSKIKIKNKKIGYEKAFKIYSVFKYESVPYDLKYTNNINLYVSKVDKNLIQAKNASQYLK